MATTKKKTEEIVTLKPIKREKRVITLAGDTPLIVHAWSEKVKKQLLEDMQKTDSKNKKKEHKPRRPVKEFIESMYWLDGMPELPDETEATDEDYEKIFYDAIEKGARFGFPANSVKKAAASAAYRQGVTKNKTQPNGTFYAFGEKEAEFIEIISDTPIMREDMVTVANGSCDLRYRGEFRNWKAKVVIEYIKNGAFSLESIIEMINLGGFCCGLGEWRGEKGGLNGSYHVE